MYGGSVVLPALWQKRSHSAKPVTSMQQAKVSLQGQPSQPTQGHIVQSRLDHNIVGIPRWIRSHEGSSPALVGVCVA